VRNKELIGRKLLYHCLKLQILTVNLKVRFYQKADMHASWKCHTITQKKLQCLGQ